MKENYKLDNGCAVRFGQEIDEYPDLSHLGQWTSNPDHDYVVVDRRGTGHWEGNRFHRFWQSQYKADDPCAEYAMQDYRRHEAYEDQQWGMVIVTASVHAPNEVKIGSAALFGVESDGGEAHLLEVCDDLEAEAMAEAKKHIAELKAVEF